ncbi:MAG: hypothetical protein HY617_01295 [Candidatus Sungbacteria bacterium]|nr:hypothetical protein [Candidatus Sungbacteria bacterium]
MISRKPLVVAKEKHLHVFQDILEIARRLGCEIRWLHENERAPYGSIVFFRKAKKGKWARPARRKVMITKSFNECTFPELAERVKKVLFPQAVSHSETPIVCRTHQSNTELERMRILEIQRIRDRHSLLY